MIEQPPLTPLLPLCEYSKIGSSSPLMLQPDDGSKQWAYKGKPLYAWVKDQKAGDKTGDGVANNAWHTAKE